jgi:hypothetical protein
MKLFLKVAAFCAVGSVLWLAWTAWRGTGVRYTERITGIDLPFSREDYQSESCDFAQLSFMRLSSTQVSDLLDSTRFTSATGSNSSANAKMLFEQFGIGDKMPVITDLKIHSGESKNNSWLFCLHESTGRLWIIVYFPDMAGDLPAGATRQQSKKANKTEIATPMKLSD